jgi:glycosidase
MSNHDFGRLTTRFGRENARAAAVLLLTLPGPAFLYQGDEIGQADGPPAETNYDRAGRDRFRHPMQWDGSPTGGFSTGAPWLPAVDPTEHNVADQREDPDSMLSLVRRVIALRRELGARFELLDAAEGVIAYRRGDAVVAVNTTNEARPVPLRGAVLVETGQGALRDGELAAHAAAVGMD